jgi:hypothetical protein
MSNTVTYHDLIVDQGQGNPDLEALNPPLSDNELTEKFFSNPPFEPPDYNLESHFRRQALSILEEVYVPFSSAIRAIRCWDDVVRCGLASRNPLTSGYWDDQNCLWIPGDQARGHQGVTGINLAGESGLGKSILVHKIASLHPQTIRHSEYLPANLGKAIQRPGLGRLQPSQKFSHVQLTHLIVTCSAIKAPKAMAESIFMAADEALGDTNYAEKYCKGNVHKLQMNAGLLARNHNLGGLIVDEVQRLQGSPETIEFLVNLNAIMKVPVMLVGTDDVFDYFELNPSIARRGNKMGDHKWERISWLTPEGKQQWKLLLGTLWPYQVVKEIVDLTDELCEVFWEAAKGIPDYCVKIFRLAQFRAMDVGVEKITAEMVRSARDGFEFSKLLLDHPDQALLRKRKRNKK